MKLSSTHSGVTIECHGRIGVVLHKSDKEKMSIIKWLGWADSTNSLAGAVYQYSWDTDELEVNYWRSDDKHVPVIEIPVQETKQDKYRFLDLE